MDLLSQYERLLELIQEHKAALEQLVEERDALRAKLADRLAIKPAALRPSVSAPTRSVDTVEIIAELGGVVDSYRLAEAIGISVSAAQRRLMRGARDGYLVRLRRGKYGLKNGGTAHPPPSLQTEEPTLMTTQ